MYHIYTTCIYYISIYDHREGSLVVNYTIEVDVSHIHNLYLQFSIYNYREGSLVVNYTIEVDISHIHNLFLQYNYL